ncbi:hypothetical protein GGR56DRAFT_613574 [Xylariaceae sp. FL0804]|nr:hypothetical protein GGR56DRAFT_613574 [Xylariaceae sp. FL0804]
MLPGFLRDSYRQYKDDTDRFATWLVNIAKQNRSDDEANPAVNADGTAAHTKGQKEKKKPSERKHSTTVGQLLAYGKAVAQSAVDVPASVLARARRAIKLRSDITAHYLGKGDVASDKRHAHFIQVLQEICELLEPRPAGAPKEKDKKLGKEPASSQNNAQAWLNRFAALTVEETEDLPESAAVPEPQGIIKVEVVEGDDDAGQNGREAHLSDAYFRLLCLFHDLQNWRAFIAQTWTEYRDLKIDLMTASVVTDNALQLARDLIGDVVDSWPYELPDGHTSLQGLVYANASLARGGHHLPSTEVGMTFNEDLADVADWVYIPTATLLKSFEPVIQDGSVPVYKPGYLGTYDPKADRANMSVPEKFKEDTIILLELLPDFCLIDMFGVPMPVQDEITRGFVNFVRDKQPTLWLCFAAQILLDTHHIMRTSRLGAFADLRMTGLRIARTIDDFWELSKTHPKPQFWPQEGDKEIKNIRESVVTFIDNDPMGHLMRSAHKEISRLPHKHPDHLLFSRNPVLCGLFMMHLNLRMQTIGQGLANQWWDVQQLAFLYNLVQQVPGSTLVWPDIELFIKIHGENRIFVGDRPKNAAQSLDRLELATGVSSAARFASNVQRRDFHRPDPNSAQNARLLVPTTKVANLFRELYLTGDNSLRVIASGNVEKLLDELSGDVTTKAAKPKKGKKAGKEMVLSSNPQQLVGRKWANTHDIGPLQLLSLIKTKLAEEEPVILFNYFGMHKRAMELLRLIRAKEHHKFVQYFTSAYMPDDSMIQNIVILIHHVARGGARAGQELGLARGLARGDTVVSRIVMSCGDVMRGYLAKNGDAAYRELRTFCKNKAQLKALEGGGDSARKKEVDEEFGYWFSLEECLGPSAMASLMTGIPVAGS